jgi:type I restriction enzyme S subunit
VRKLKYVALVQSSNVDKKTIDGEIPVNLCNYVDVYYNDRITDEIEFMQGTVEPRELEKFQIQKGDVLITKDSEDWRDIAVPSFVPSTMDNVVCGYHLAQVRPQSKDLDGSFLFYAFCARGVNDQFRVAAKGITRFGLAIGAIAGGWFPIPPLDEQRAIASFLDCETERLDRLVSGLPKSPTGTGLLCQFVRLVHE